MSYSYTVVSGSWANALVFAQEITDLLNKGWQLQGGVCVTPALNYFQALVKAEEEPANA